jgi:hypothetical protein
LPGTTTVKIVGVPQSYYAVRLNVTGPTQENPTNGVLSVITVTSPRSTEFFVTNYQHYYTPTSLYTTVAVEVMETSSSNWTSIGFISTYYTNITDILVEDVDYLYFIEFEWNNIIPNEVPIDE